MYPHWNKLIVGSTDVWVSILEFNRQGLALYMASIHKRVMGINPRIQLSWTYLFTRNKEFPHSTNVWVSILEFNCHGLTLDTNSV